MKIENNTIVVTNYDYKLEILKEMNNNSSLININFMTMNEFLKKFYFSYDENAIYYLMNKYNLKRDIAEIYIKNMYYVSDNSYESDKLSKLVSMKNELIENKLLIFDELFYSYIKSKNIVFYNYNYYKTIEKSMIDEISAFTSVKCIPKVFNSYNHDIRSFSNIWDEVTFVAVSILKLIESGVLVSDIKLTNIDDDYTDIINKVFKMVGLRVNISNDKIISSNIANEFLSLEGSIENRIDVLSVKYKNSIVLDRIISIVNKYISFSNIDIVNEMIKYDFKNSLIPSDKYLNTIEVIDYKNYPCDDKYVFMLSFNQNTIPVIYKDEEYITDDLKDSILLDKTVVLNKLEKESAINNILNIKNLVITYKNSSSFGTYYPSNLISDLGFEVIPYSEDYSISYCDMLNKIKASMMLDNYVKTGVIDNNLALLYNNYDILYGKYNNKFTDINKSLFKDYISSSFNLSYSSMDSFYKCPFRYYVSNVLKLNIFEERFEAYIGSLFHYVLEKGLKGKRDVSSLILEFINNNERVLSKKEEFFVSKLESELDFVLSVILEQLENSDLKNMLFEERIEIKKFGDISVTFKGFIDKIMYKEEGDSCICAIIDYKTGFTDINLSYVPFGLSMQLPVYLYLAKNSKLKNVSFAGFYLQRVLNNEVSIDPKKSYDVLKREGVLLYGYSNSDQEIISLFDHSYKNSQYIKSMKLDNKGEFSRYSKILSNKQISKLVNIVDDKIDNAIKEISSANFNIKPKRTEKEVLGCKYCEFKDICFKENDDEELIVEDKELSFLGGDLDA